VLLAIGAVSWFASDKFRDLVLLAVRGDYIAVRPTSRQCKKRAEEFQAKVEVIKRDAKRSLKVGAKKDDVARFFASENIPLTFDRIGPDHEATGTIYFKGIAECENLACGDDSSLIGVRVKVDIDGAVLVDPVVIGMYTDCL
jgi:hypothetical protein